MRLVLEEPSKLRVYDATDVEIIGLQAVLKYKDKSVEHVIRSLKKNFFYEQRYGKEWVQRRIDQLNIELYKTVLFDDEKGKYTLPGLKDLICRNFPDAKYENRVIYPSFKLIPWQKTPPYTPKEYQQKALDALLKNNHAHIEVATGLGKSFISILLAKNAGLPTIIATPSASIAKQFYKELVTYFGKKTVGLLGAGKREIGKHILVAVGKSLSMVEGDEKEEFKKYQVLCSDESHTLPANQFSKFCNDLLAHCPYRWFMSATQERNDGKDLLLEGIIGPKVYEKTIQEGIESGDLAKIGTIVFDVMSTNDFVSSNALLMNQKHYYSNDQIINMISILVKDAMSKHLPTLILIDEHEQEKLLKDKLGNIYEYACGGSDTLQICEDFNKGKVMCVVGTSAVSTGTNFKPVRLTINWQGGKAETKFKQGVIGRSTRIDKDSGKTDCKLVDFRVVNVPMLNRHANARIQLYKEVGPVSIVSLNK